MVLDKAAVVSLDAEENAALTAAEHAAQLAALEPAALWHLRGKFRPVAEVVQPHGIRGVCHSDITLGWTGPQGHSSIAHGLRQVLPVHEGGGHRQLEVAEGDLPNDLLPQDEGIDEAEVSEVVQGSPGPLLGPRGDSETKYFVSKCCTVISMYILGTSYRFL